MRPQDPERATEQDVEIDPEVIEDLEPAEDDQTEMRGGGPCTIWGSAPH